MGLYDPGEGVSQGDPVSRSGSGRTDVTTDQESTHPRLKRATDSGTWGPRSTTHRRLGDKSRKRVWGGVLGRTGVRIVGKPRSRRGDKFTEGRNWGEMKESLSVWSPWRS